MEPVCNECAELECQDCGCDSRRQSVTVYARGLRASCCQLLVCDLNSCQEVLVHTNDACCFRPGQCVCITYSGAMTMSIPPQISAECVKIWNGGGNACCCR